MQLAVVLKLLSASETEHLEGELGWVQRLGRGRFKHGAAMKSSREMSLEPVITADRRRTSLQRVNECTACIQDELNSLEALLAAPRA